MNIAVITQIAIVVIVVIAAWRLFLFFGKKRELMECEHCEKRIPKKEFLFHTQTNGTCVNRVEKEPVT